jgi:predicted GH43/DUF377 family glycosyl hydrolase
MTDMSQKMNDRLFINEDCSMSTQQYVTIHGRYNDSLEQRLSPIINLTWQDHTGNPLIKPTRQNVIADPTLISPDESPDGLWHMIMCGSHGRIIQLTSHDGVTWSEQSCHDWAGFSPSVHRHDGQYYLFYQMNHVPERCWIVCRKSDDLKTWSESWSVLEPDLGWEDMEFRPTCRNPCLTPMPDGTFRLYYSGGVKRIPDLGFEEPANIGVATAPQIEGPYSKHPVPLLAPDNADPYRNIGAGAMKVYYLPEFEAFVGFNNGIYWDTKCEHSRSAIHMLISDDGIDWFDCKTNPIFAPMEKSWKSSLVYQLSVAAYQDRLWMYYNARDGWAEGVEAIGLATAKTVNLKHFCVK